jgi:Ca2+-binding RTX toxin-like protein
MAVLNGTPNPETIFGTNTKDTIFGLGGNDRLFGRNGNDTIYGDGATALDAIKVRITGQAFDSVANIFPTFGLYVNGVLVGTEKVTARRTMGEFQEFTFNTGALSNVNPNSISVKLLNDKYAVVDGLAKDNNIYVQSVAVNGTELSTAGNPWLRPDGLLWGTGGYNINFTAAPALATGLVGGDDFIVGNEGSDTLYGGAGNDALYGDNAPLTIEVVASAQLYETLGNPSPNGAPLVGLFIDGFQVGTAQYVQANEQLGETQTLVFQAQNITQGGTLELRYLNDIAGVHPGDEPLAPGEIADRNVHIKSVKVTGSKTETFTAIDAETYQVTDPAYLGAGNPEFRDGQEILAWNGSLKFNIGTGTGLFLAGGNDVLVGGTGEDILNGGRDTGSVAIIGGAITVTGTGDLLTGGGSADLFQYAHGFGVDTITDFEKGVDSLQLAANAASFALVDALNGVLVDFGGGEGVFLQNINSTNLTDDIVLVASA